MGRLYQGYFMAQIGKRIQIGLPPFHEKRLLLWAYCKAQSKTNLCQNIVQARVEANEPQILEMVGDRAKDWGCSTEEAIERILKEMGWSVEDTENYPIGDEG